MEGLTKHSRVSLGCLPAGCSHKAYTPSLDVTRTPRVDCYGRMLSLCESPSRADLRRTGKPATCEAGQATMLQHRPWVGGRACQMSEPYCHIKMRSSLTHWSALLFTRRGQATCRDLVQPLRRVPRSNLKLVSRHFEQVCKTAN